MKLVLLILIALSIVPVSIVTMIYGWGMSPSNWCWIAFGYLWMLVPGVATSLMKD